MELAPSRFEWKKNNHAHGQCALGKAQLGQWGRGGGQHVFHFATPKQQWTQSRRRRCPLRSLNCLVNHMH